MIINMSNGIVDLDLAQPLNMRNPSHDFRKNRFDDVRSCCAKFAMECVCEFYQKIHQQD